MLRSAASITSLALSLTIQVACQAASGPDTDASPTWRFDESAAMLGPHRPLIDSVLRATISTVAAVVPASGVSVTIIADQQRAISGYGIGGRTFSAYRIEVYIDPATPALSSVLRNGLGPMVAHEMHHAARWRSVGYGTTLFEAMISEGLADDFAIELLHASPPPWTRGFPDALTDSMTARARPEFDKPGYNHAKWFFDADPTLPRWTGYTLGYRYVQAYRALHATTPAASLVALPAPNFRPE